MAETPTSLRARASRLDTAARALLASDALTTHRRAGPDTWRGPTADRCVADLELVRARVLVAARDLERQAQLLRVSAASLEDSGG